MSFWPILNVVCGLIAAGIITYKLALCPDRFNLPERFGMGLIGAGMILTLGPIWVLAQGPSIPPTPFDDWGSGLLRLGCCLYFAGRMKRHDIANWSARRQARHHFREKGQ